MSAQDLLTRAWRRSAQPLPREVRLRVPLARFVPSRWELECAWLDARAAWAGYCNDTPYRRKAPGGGTGYAWWRCAKARGHAGDHRFQGYVWGPDRDALYSPLRDGLPQPAQPDELARPVVPSYGQRLRGDDWYRANLPTQYGLLALYLDARDWLNGVRRSARGNR